MQMKHQQQQQQQQQHLDKVGNPRDHGIASATCGHCAADELGGQALPAVAVGTRIRHCSCGIVAAANLGGCDAYFVAPATRCSAGESLWGLRGATVCLYAKARVLTSRCMLRRGKVRSHLAHRNTRVDDGHACIVLHGAAGAYGLRLEYFLQVT